MAEKWCRGRAVDLWIERKTSQRKREETHTEHDLAGACNLNSQAKLKQRNDHSAKRDKETLKTEIEIISIEIIEVVVKVTADVITSHSTLSS